MKKITLDYTNCCHLTNGQDLSALQERISKGHQSLMTGRDFSDDYLGWFNWPLNIQQQELARIQRLAQRIQEQADTLVVIGIGGSYLGARAGIEMLNKQDCEVYYAGYNLSANDLSRLIKLLDGRDIALNVISKSGTTMETAIAFRILRQYLLERYGAQEAKQRIYVTTDCNQGALKDMADQEGYARLAIPENIGGRYSVLTAVGLLPMAVSGIDIVSVLEGGRKAIEDLDNDDLRDNQAYQYAGLRNLLYRQGKVIEVLVSYESRFDYFGKWFQQLFGESEGKNGQGIYPTNLNYTTDLHSMGQYLQDGLRNIFETFLNVQKPAEDIYIHECPDNLDGLNYLAGQSLGSVQEKAFKATIKAHAAGGVPNILLHIPEISAYYFGYLVYFFQRSCAMSGYLLGVNPFDQPGVEVYKKNMFKLLGRP